MTSTTSAPRISIVIVNWNSGSLLEQCILSILENAGGHEVIIVDNCSGDSSLAFAVRLENRVAIIRNETNTGFAAANNIGWQRSCGDLILFLNPDAEAFPGAVRALAAPLHEDPAVWAAAGKLIGPDGRAQAGFNVRGFPTLGSVFAETFFLDEVMPRNPWTRKYLATDFDYDSAQDVDQPAAACLMVRRSVLERLGGFDERYRPAWFEDVDFCWRLHRAGGRIRFVPAAHFVHHGGSSLRRLDRGEFLVHFHRNRELFFARHHGKQAAARIRMLGLAGLRLRAAFSLIYPLVAETGRLSCARLFWHAAGRIGEAQEGAR